VLSGLCGLFMPSENEVYATQRDAEEAARKLARQFRDDGERVTGSAREGYYQVGDNWCIEITECDEAACLEEIRR
jgi:hypothetical protein